MPDRDPYCEFKRYGVLDEIQDLNTSMSTGIINQQKHNNYTTTDFMEF